MEEYIYITCSVAVTFSRSDGVLFTVSEVDIGRRVEAPIWIAKTQLFRMMKQLGTLIVMDGRENVAPAAGETEAEPPVSVRVEQKKARKKKDDAE